MVIVTRFTTPHARNRSFSSASRANGASIITPAAAWNVACVQKKGCGPHNKTTANSADRGPMIRRNQNHVVARQPV